MALSIFSMRYANTLLFTLFFLILSNGAWAWERGGGLVFERLQAVGEGSQDIHITTLRPTFFVLQNYRRDQDTIFARAEVSLLAMQRDSSRVGRDIFFMGEIAGGFLRKAGEFNVGILLRNRAQALNLPSMDRYEVFTRWLWALGPMLEWERFVFHLLHIPDQGSGIRQTRDNFEISLGHKFKYQQREFFARVFYGNNSIEAVDTRNYGLSLDYFF
jgi:hypothetical protein